MAASIVLGRQTWSLSTDAEGYRTYKLATLVETDDPLDGPYTVRNAPGLPQPGSYWIFGNDFDDWVWCRWTSVVTALVTNEPNQHWKIEQEFSNKPDPDRQQRCNKNPITDPILEPQKLSGSFNKYTEPASKDRFGLAIVNSSFELVKGPQVEFDANRTTVKIEQNVADLQLPLLDKAKNCVNDASLWGLPRRCIKLSSVTWSRRFYGSCSVYYTRSFEFDVNARVDPQTGQTVSGFDRDLLDEGTKVLFGQWDTAGNNWVLKKIGGTIAPNPRDPNHFIQYIDKSGKSGHVILNGFGIPAGAQVTKQASVYFSLVSNLVHTSSDIGNTSRWVVLTTDPANPPAWAAGTYSSGALVTYLGGKYICTAASTTANPTGNGWQTVSSGPTDKGTYDPLFIYDKNDYVTLTVAVGPFWLSLVASGSHTAGDIGNAAKWAKLATLPTVVPVWESTDNPYPFGSLAQDPENNNIYVVKAASGTGFLGTRPGDNPSVWLQVTLADKGIYDGTANYNAGDYVTKSTASNAGNIHVEKYDEFPMLLLGIPTVLV